ncbi:HAD domain-containing protein [Rhizobacter sp. LjRoot28]|uniref:HAD domain-containing protein n=1 Tax=Rhizobacter sp. LjRoot28 TaxID=3342309 RepID=UPI003ECF7C9C
MDTHHESLRVIYLGISGVLHPSQSLYELIERKDPWEQGHRRYEAVPVLEGILRGWPDARIVLTSPQPWKHGLPAVLKELGPELGGKVLGFTFEDLTTKVPCPPRHRPIGDADYWRLLKSEIVRRHVAWLKPVAWAAVDDETILWTDGERQQHLVEVDGCQGLLDPEAQDRLITVLTGNFGPAGGETLKLRASSAITKVHRNAP